MTYYAPSCDMLFASSSHEVYLNIIISILCKIINFDNNRFRINLDQGRFLAPYETKRPSVNFIKQNPIHQLIVIFIFCVYSFTIITC